MNAPKIVDLRMLDVSQIALGGNQVTRTNAIVLHGLFDLILKKLNCEDEKIILRGYDAMELQRILDTSKPTPLIMDTGDSTRFKEVSCVEQLKKEIYEVGRKLDQHIKENTWRLSDEKPLPPCADIDKEYERVESLCSTCDPDVKIACDLLKNDDFIQKLLNATSIPIVKRCDEVKKKIRLLRRELCEMMERVNENYSNCERIPDIFDMVENIEQQVNNSEVTFLHTMNEMQNIADTKTNRSEVLAFKAYVQDRISKIWRKLADIEKEKDIIFAAGTVDEESNYIPMKKSEIVSLPSHTEQKQKLEVCGCSPLHGPQPTIIERMANMSTTRIAAARDRRSSIGPSFLNLHFGN